jgi:hypothetical protein
VRDAVITTMTLLSTTSHARRRLFLLLVLTFTCQTYAIGFANPQAQGMLERNQEKLIKEHGHSHKLAAKPNDDSKDKVKENSKEYYEGMLSSSLTSEDPDRVTGDAILKPTVKFVGSVSVLIAALLLVFLISNGLLFI